jgi:hypothetical protein
LPKAENKNNSVAVFCDAPSNPFNAATLAVGQAVTDDLEVMVY